MKYTIEKKTKIFYILAAIILVAVLGVFYWNNQKVKATSDLVKHTQDVLRTSDAVLLDIMNIETGARAYILTGNEGFLEPYNHSLLSISNNLATLKTLTKDNPRQQVRLDSMNKTDLLRTLVLKKVIDAKKNNQLGEVEQKQFITEGLLMTNKIKERIGAITTEEFALLKQRRI